VSLAAGYDAIVCDLDGVVYRGDHAVPHAVEALAAAGLPVVYATNNASRPPGVVADHLRRLGVHVDDSSVVTSSEAAACVLFDEVAAGAPVLAVGGEGVSRALRERGFAPVDAAADRPVAVVQGYGPDVTAADLAQAAYAVQRGALWVATNTDATLPTEHGAAPGNGSLVHAVAMAAGRGPDVVAGKPAPPLYLLCAERLGVHPSRVLAGGDRLETDIEGAHRAGMDSLLVLTGVHGLDDALAATPERRPTWVVPDLRSLTGDTDAVHRLAEGLRDVWARRDRGDQEAALPAALRAVVEPSAE